MKFKVNQIVMHSDSILEKFSKYLPPEALAKLKEEEGEILAIDEYIHVHWKMQDEKVKTLDWAIKLKPMN